MAKNFCGAHIKMKWKIFIIKPIHYSFLTYSLKSDGYQTKFLNILPSDEYDKHIGFHKNLNSSSSSEKIPKNY